MDTLNFEEYEEFSITKQLTDQLGNLFKAIYVFEKY